MDETKVKLIACMNWIEIETRFVFFPDPKPLNYLRLAISRIPLLWAPRWKSSRGYLSKFEVFILFLRLVFVRLVAKKVRSHSAVDTGRTNEQTIRTDILLKFGGVDSHYIVKLKLRWDLTAKIALWNKNDYTKY